MAQYFWQAADHAVGETLSTLPFVADASWPWTDLRICETATAPHYVPERALLLQTLNAGFWRLLYAPAGSQLVAGRDAEIWMDFYEPPITSSSTATGNANHRFKAAMLMSGSDASITQAYGGAHWEKQQGAMQYDAGTYTTIDLTAANDTATTARRVGQRARIEASGTFKVRRFLAPAVTALPRDTENTSTWQITAAHTLSQTTGGVGVFCRGTGSAVRCTKYLIGFGVGTDGDPAPTGPVGGRQRSRLILTPW